MLKVKQNFSAVVTTSTVVSLDIAVKGVKNGKGGEQEVVLCSQHYLSGHHQSL